MKQPLKNLENKVAQMTTLAMPKKANPYADAFNNTDAPRKIQRPDQYPSNNRSAVSYVRAAQAVEKARYFYALLNPYASCIERLPVVVPSVISIPTTPTYHIQRKTLITNANDVHIRFCPILRPIKLPSSNAPYLSTYIATSGGSTESPFNWVGFLNHPLFPNMTKGRLVGCELRIRYVGTVLNQAGTIESAMTFGDDTGERNVPGSTMASTYTDLPDLNMIHQMTWYERQEISREAVTRLIWVPVDYNDRDFHNPDVNSPSAGSTYPNIAADVCWYAKISGLATAQPILIEVAEIWEQQLNPTQDVYSRTTVSSIEPNAVSSKVIGQALAVRNNSNFIEQSASAISKFASSGIDYVSQHAGELAKMGLSALAKMLF